MNQLLALGLVAISLFASLLVVDFLSGLLHWAEDTWTAPGGSALLDKYVVLENIEHHRLPGTIRDGNYWVTNRVGIALACIVAVVMIVLHVRAWQAYVIALMASQANQVHLWAHSANPRANSSPTSIMRVHRP